jgi:hypothetical protein
MSEFSHHPAQFEGIPAQHDRRQKWIAAIFLATIADGAMTLASATHWAPTPSCRLHPKPVLMHAVQAPIATSRGGSPCFIAANNTDARVEALEIVTSPSNGWVATRGKTAMVYFPNAGFKGTDAFELRLVRRTDTEAFLTTTINMKVKVD